MTSRTSTRTSTASFPLLETAPAAIALALTAGLLNAWTFGQVQAFATVQSGNLISVGYFLVAGELPRVGVALASVAAFALGACLCSVFVLWRTRRGGSYSVDVLTFECGTLVAVAALSAEGVLAPWVAAWIISFLAGVQGNAFHRETGMLYGNVAVTFVVQMAASLLGRAVGRRLATDGQPHLRPAGAYGLVLLAFAAGGGGGFALTRWWSGAPLICAALVLVILLTAAMTVRGAVDPSQNAPTP